ncbi:MAG: hypothetical protein ACLFPQ_01850 [Candidatus Woesearchaeota archaeon]
MSDLEDRCDDTDIDKRRWEGDIHRIIYSSSDADRTDLDTEIAMIFQYLGKSVPRKTYNVDNQKTYDSPFNMPLPIPRKNHLNGPYSQYNPSIGGYIHDGD